MAGVDRHPACPTPAPTTDQPRVTLFTPLPPPQPPPNLAPGTSCCPSTSTSSTLSRPRASSLSSSGAWRLPASRHARSRSPATPSAEGVHFAPHATCLTPHPGRLSLYSPGPCFAAYCRVACPPTASSAAAPLTTRRPRLCAPQPAPHVATLPAAACPTARAPPAARPAACAAPSPLVAATAELQPVPLLPCTTARRSSRQPM